MKNTYMDEMFRAFSFNEKPSELITEVCGMSLPEEYLSFMCLHDGGEGPLGENNYGCFYPLHELESVNEEYDVQNSWPGWIVIGSDLGGELWAYNPEKQIYCQIDSCNTAPDTFSTISGSFEAFLNRMDEESA